ncbi:hypothetical protein [Herbaspirillum frisingense]|uniref:hypothetical protein n=1 Tax=Herbaspirillum frisingense TaxID=92645 RepID=UPI001F280D83|nr:hypothetical protein [Herbaspirillum frisingense]UIN20790.1 hypothetical protein LAZ82_20325 [Herbaspirillum frisingense]
MPVPSTITDLSVVSVVNSPAGTDPIGNTLDDYLRTIQALLRREQAQGAAIASAATVNIGGNTDGNYLHITGTTTITSFGTVSAGISRTLVFDSSLTLTHNSTSLILPGAANIVTAAGDVAEFVSEGSGNWRCVKYSSGGAPATVFGQCRLTQSGGNLKLSPFNGNRLTINGQAQVIPSAGITLAATSLTPSTLYYVYAYMNSGTMTLEASTTAHATDANTGVEIKSGDSSRTLVGMARPITGPAWQDTAAQRFVRSWFNDPGIAGLNWFTANRQVTSVVPSYVEINSEIRCEFLCWSGEIVQVGGSGNSTQTVAGITNHTAVAFDGLATETGSWSSGYTPSNNFGVPYTVNLPKTGLLEGYHYATLVGALGASGGGVATYAGGTPTATAPSVCTITIQTKK